ncbi:MAG: adenylyltransferase/cytidyltransferase family protein [Christensenellaceae bacterium]|jgi:D-beta-D-heptose 7-phosphate kinase/D-beta-D-heptose 1-phosphate adenosyltransferase|nr:adenylyltransferase/cytidyltransferase family protein [Christensenellaceae bacterium]
MKQKKVVFASGCFDPLHIGHIEYLEGAKALGDKLIVSVKSDDLLIKKKGVPFMHDAERAALIRALRCVDEAYVSSDLGATIPEILEKIKPDIYARGYDRGLEDMSQRNIDACERLGIEIITVTHEKRQSSTAMLANYLERKQQLVDKPAKQ